MLEHLNLNRITHYGLTCDSVYIINGDIALGDLSIKNPEGQELIYMEREGKIKERVIDSVFE